MHALLHPLPWPIGIPTGAALASALIASLWQGLLLTAATALLLRLLPGLSAATRAGIWTAVLALVVALPTLALVLTGNPDGSGGPALHAGLHVASPVATLFLALWCIASLLRLAQLAASALRLRQVLQRAQPILPSPALLAELGDVALPQLCSSPDVDRPSVAGFLRPRILFPLELLLDLSARELAQIVLHESEHLRRWDDWVNLLQQISLVLLPLNPALLWVNRRLAFERELACDERVLETTQARKAYAACLARVAESAMLRRGVALVLGILGPWARKPELAARVERILHGPIAHTSRPRARFITGTLLTGALAFTVVLAHSPRLISFSAAPAQEAQSASPVVTPPQAVQASLLPSGDVASPGPKPTLVKAVLPVSTHQRSQRPRAIALRAVMTTAKRPHGPRDLRSTASRVLPATPHVVLTRWQQEAPAEGGAAAQHAPVLRLASFVVETTGGDTQVWYTAVAVRDGWIVVPL